MRCERPSAGLCVHCGRQLHVDECPQGFPTKLLKISWVDARWDRMASRDCHLPVCASHFLGQEAVLPQIGALIRVFNSLSRSFDVGGLAFVANLKPPNRDMRRSSEGAADHASVSLRQ